MAFLQETAFYVVEEGRLSDGWRSPLQRKLAADADGLVSGSDVGGNGTRGTKRNLASVGYDRDAPETDELERFARGPEDRWRRDRGLKSENAPEGQESCPLIYTVDAKTAKKHGLILFQVSLLVPLHVYSCPITSCSQLDGVRARVCRLVVTLWHADGVVLLRSIGGAHGTIRVRFRLCTTHPCIQSCGRTPDW